MKGCIQPCRYSYSRRGIVKQLYHPNYTCGEVLKVSIVRSAARPLLTFTRPSSLDVQFVDFDGVRFHLSTPERKTALLLSMSIRCWDELVKYGVDSILQREYGNRLKPQPEPEYNVSLEIDIEQFPPEGGECFYIVI